LPVGDNNELRLYKNVFSPAAPLTLAVIGLVQPIGAIMTLAEIQARWVVQIFKGRLGLPEVAEMNKWIDKYHESIHRRYIKRARHTIQVHIQKKPFNFLDQRSIIFMNMQKKK